MNTNYVPPTDADATRVGNDLSNAIRMAFDDEATVRRMITFRGGNPRDFNRIRRMEADWRPEIAPRTGMLHAHILFEVEHTVPKPGIHLNIKAVQNGIRKNGSTPPVKALPYINVRGFASRSDLRKYLSKGDLEVNDPKFGSFIRSGAL